MATRRNQLLEFAILGLLHEHPMHGYELRKRLNSALGLFRALSFGTLYPALRGLVAAGLLAEQPGPAGSATSKRPRITYLLTDAGRGHFATLTEQIDTDAYDDDGFELRVAFFARTESGVRLRILEGRRARLEERLAALRAGTGQRSGDPLLADSWGSALRRHTEETLERDIRWLSELAAAERSGPAGRPGALTDPNHPAFTPRHPTRK